MNVFKVSDIVEFAIRIEENGENFYRYAVQLTSDEELKKAFLELAQAEAQHKKLFERLFSRVDQERPPETYDGEYAAYLHNYVDNNIIFKKELLEGELAKIKDIPSALDFALRREMDSILYYHEIKIFVPPKDHAIVDEIIEEERRHFKGLSNLRSRYTN